MIVWLGVYLPYLGRKFVVHRSPLAGEDGEDLVKVGEWSVEVEPMSWGEGFDWLRRKGPISAVHTLG